MKCEQCGKDAVLFTMRGHFCSEKCELDFLLSDEYVELFFGDRIRRFINK